MTFEEYYRKYALYEGTYKDALQHAWDCASKVQEKRIDEMENDLLTLSNYLGRFDRVYAQLVLDRGSDGDLSDIRAYAKQLSRTGG